MKAGESISRILRLCVPLRYVPLIGFCSVLQFEAGESRVGVVQYSHDNTQELVAMGDANIDNIGALKQ